MLLFCYITNHLMTGALGNSEFCFPRLRLGKHWDSRETKFTVSLGTSHLKSVKYFRAKWGPLFHCLSNIFRNTQSWKLRIITLIFPSFSPWKYCHVMRLDRSRASENIWWSTNNVRGLLWEQGYKEDFFPYPSYSLEQSHARKSISKS